MQFESADFVGANIDIGLTGNDYLRNPNSRSNYRDGYNQPYNPNFGPTYNYFDDHDYGYSSRSVAEQAKERLHTQNGLNYDNVGRPYPGPQPPTDFHYFTQRDTQQGFKSGLTDKQRDYAILISSNIHYIVLLVILVISVVIGVVNTALLIVLYKGK